VEANITDQESLSSPAVAAELPLMFTIAFAKFIWWKALLAMVIWPNYLN
jgi:hypothetical protein